MGRRQVSGQQNVSYSISTRRETWSHVTTDKLTVAYAAQTVSNFGANREFRTLICLGDTAVNWPARRNEFLPRGYISEFVPICRLIHFIHRLGSYWNELNFRRVTLYSISRFYLELVSRPRNVFLRVRINRDWFWLLNEHNQAYQSALVTGNYFYFRTRENSFFILIPDLEFICDFYLNRVSLTFASPSRLFTIELIFIWAQNGNSVRNSEIKLACLSHSRVEYFER